MLQSLFSLRTPSRNNRIHKGWSIDKRQELEASEGIISKDVPITAHQKTTGVLLLYRLLLVLRLVEDGVPLVVKLIIEVIMLV